MEPTPFRILERLARAFKTFQSSSFKTFFNAVELSFQGKSNSEL